MNKTYAIVLAGGKGTRLWPLSRRLSPKHVMPHPVTGPTTLLQQTLDRLKGVIDRDHVLIVTVRSHVRDVWRTLRSFPKQNIIIENEAHNTAPAIALATAEILSRDQESFVVTINSDCFVESPRQYRSSIHAALGFAKQYSSRLILLGVPAKYPDPGLGYIVPKGPSISDSPGLYRVQRFVEKPNLHLARRLLKRSCFWNPTVIVGQTKTLSSAFQRHLPGLWNGIQAIRAVTTTRDRQQLFARLPTISIDVGLLEREKKLLVMDAGEMGWRDVGQWATILDIHALQQKKPIVSIGSHQDYQSSRMLAYNTTPNLLATVGLDNIIVVATNDVILVANARFAHDVKHLVEQLEKSGYAQFI